MRSAKTQLGVLLLFLLLALVLTYPAVVKVGDGSALPGLKDFDEFEYAWLLWWYKASLIDRQTAPNQLPFYYPMETSQPLVDVTPLGWLLSLPLVLLLGPIRAYSAFWLANFALCAFTAYLLALRLTRSRYGALIGGVIFAFYPGKMLHGLGHMGDMMIFMFPLYALFLFDFFENASRRRAAMLAMVTAIGLLIDFRHIALFYFPFTFVFLAYQAIRAPRRLFSRRILGRGLLAAGAAFLLTLPFFGAFLVSSLGGQLGHLKEGGLEASSADLLSFVLPPMTHPLLGQIPGLRDLMQAVWSENLYIETCLYMGAVAVVLAAIALIKRRCGAWFWLALICAGAVLALGPVLTVAGQPVGGFHLPYAWLYRLPFYEWVRIPARFDMTIKLALAMLAAMGAASLLERVSRRWRPALTAGLGALILFEYLTFVPYPMADIVPSPFLEGLANDGEAYGILQLTSHEYAMYLQTLHGHPMVEGHIHRWPPGGSEWALQLHGLAVYPPTAERRYWDILDERLPYGRDGGDIFAGSLDVSPANILARLNIRYIVFDRRLGWDPADKKRYRERLRTYFGDPIDEDGRFTVHEVRAADTAGPEMAAGAGWFPLEGGEQDRWRWIGDDAGVDVKKVPEGTHRLLLAVRPVGAPKHLVVAAGDLEEKEYHIEGLREIITPPFRLDEGKASMHFTVEGGCDRPFNVLAGNLDRRCLGVAFHEVRLFPNPDHPYRFGEQLVLLGHEHTMGTGDDHALYINLYWQALSRMDRNYTVFVHVLDARGERIGQEDQLLTTRQGVPTSGWEGGEGVRALYRLELPPGVGWDDVRVKVGVYDVASMERLTLQGDNSGENVAVLK